jgi:hypothetical protein
MSKLIPFTPLRHPSLPLPDEDKVSAFDKETAQFWLFPSHDPGNHGWRDVLCRTAEGRWLLAVADDFGLRLPPSREWGQCFVEITLSEALRHLALARIEPPDALLQDVMSRENGGLPNVQCEAAGSNEGGPPAEENRGAIGDSEPLSRRQMNILVALLDLGATESDKRQTTPAIAKKAEGPYVNPDQLKESVASLCDLGLVATKEGRGGGCWLTDKGKVRAERLRKL